MASSSKVVVDMSEEEEEEEVYEVEKLMGHRRSITNKNKIEYLIKWKDYDNVYNSWEDEKNVYSKGLVQEYWNTQPYTLQAFRNNTHNDKRPNEGSSGSSSSSSASSSSAVATSSSSTPTTQAKKRPTPSAVLLELEKKRKLADIREAELTAEPPKGLTWQDINTINNVFYSGKSTYFAEIRWTRPDLVSYVPTRIIRKNNPLKLIHYYESNLDFYVENQ